jgi:hypothetical protein
VYLGSFGQSKAGELTPPRHLIPPIICPGFVCAHICLVALFISRFKLFHWTWNKRHRRIIPSASYFDIPSVAAGTLTIQFYFKRDGFSFVIAYVATSQYHLHMAYLSLSELIPCARACSAYYQFLSRVRVLTDKKMLQEFLQSHLINRIHHYYECRIGKFHRGDKIRSLGRGFALIPHE